MPFWARASFQAIIIKCSVIEHKGEDVFLVFNYARGNIALKKHLIFQKLRNLDLRTIPGETMITIKNPYPGFNNGSHRPFEAKDAAYFHGREQVVDVISLRLRSSGFVALYSQPKYGKTSLLKAGIIARLQEEGMYARNGTEWRTMYCRMQEEPIKELARALSQPRVLTDGKIKTTLEEHLIKQFQSSKHALVRVLEEAENTKKYNLLLALDDFGKVLQDDVPEAEQNKFFDLLLTLLKTRHLAVYLLVCLDDIDLEAKHTKVFKKFYRLMEENKQRLTLLNQAELSAAIINPAHKEGGGIEDSVVDYLCDELLEDEDQLRKLQLYMHRSWLEYLRTRKKGARLNLQHLNRANGLKSKAKVMKKGSSQKEAEPIVKQESESYNHVYLRLKSGDRKIFQKIVSILLAFQESNTQEKLTTEQLMKATGASKSLYNSLRNKFLSLFHTQDGQVSLYRNAIPEEWEPWIEAELNAVRSLHILVEMAIAHYIDGKGIKELSAEQDMKKLSSLRALVSFDLHWASIYTDQAELALDLWDKIKNEVPSSLSISTGKASRPKTDKKKLTLGQKGSIQAEKADVAQKDDISEEEAIARLLAQEEEGPDNQSDKENAETEEDAEIRGMVAGIVGDDPDIARAKLKLKIKGKEEEGKKKSSDKKKKIVIKKK